MKQNEFFVWFSEPATRSDILVWTTKTKRKKNADDIFIKHKYLIICLDSVVHTPKTVADRIDKATKSWNYRYISKWRHKLRIPNISAPVCAGAFSHTRPIAADEIIFFFICRMHVYSFCHDKFGKTQSKNEIKYLVFSEHRLIFYRHNIVCLRFLFFFSFFLFLFIFRFFFLHINIATMRCHW